jgi:hypothetical protein
MQDCSTEQAHILLPGQERLCVGCRPWEPWPLQQGTVIATGGIVDDDGISTGLYAELMFRRSQKTKTVRYKFTVFHATRWGPERVYQLDISQSERPTKDWHHLPHEHWGAERLMGSASWLEWSYDEVLDYFCDRAGLAFDQRPQHPEHFSLEG